MRRIASPRLSLPTGIIVLCGLALAGMLACPDAVLAVERGESIRGELRALREEVQVVRRDVRRLIELLEERVGFRDPSQHDESSDAPPESVSQEVMPDVWELTLREAIRIALENSEMFTLVSDAGTSGGPITIRRKDPAVGLTDAEDAALKLVGEVEQAYWDVWVGYRNVDTMRAARDSVLEVWRAVRGEKEAFNLSAEADAGDRYFLFRSQAEEALAELYAAGKGLRPFLGLPETDGRLIRPIDEPTCFEARFDWTQAIAEAHNLPLLKRQRWQVRRAEMEAEAVAVRLPVLERQRWQPQRVEEEAEAVAVRLPVLERQRWQPQRVEEEAEAVAVPIAVPLGFRKELAGLRNAQLKLAKERAVLEDAEISVGYELAEVLRDLDRAYVVVQTNHNRRLAAGREIEALRERLADRKVSRDALADAQSRSVAATTDYWRSLAEFATALKDVHLEKGSLLSFRQVVFDETAAAEPEEDDGDKSD